MIREDHEGFIPDSVEMLGAADNRRRLQHARREGMMDAPCEGIVGVVRPVGAGCQQPRAQRIDGARSGLVDRALDAGTNLTRVGMLACQEPDDRLDKWLTPASNFRFHQCQIPNS